MVSRYYQDELQYLRNLGREFAEAYPALAPMLGDRGADPEVERLLEGVAFLTARIRQKLDDGMPEVMHSIAALLFPQLLRPFPAATILEFAPSLQGLRERKVIPAGSEFDSAPIRNVRCRFSSSWPLEIVPWTIENTRLESTRAGQQELRLDIVAPSGAPILQIAENSLRLHLAGEERTSVTLLLWLLEETDDVLLALPGSGARAQTELSLGKRAVRPVGFDDTEALLPLREHLVPGLRLLQEYYAFPAKFAFIDVLGIRRLSELDPTASRFSLIFRFNRPLPLAQHLPPRSVLLHCVPVINLFKTTAEPIRLSAERERYLLAPAGLRAEHGEVYSISKIEALGQRARTQVTPFLGQAEALSPGNAAELYYTLQFEPRVRGSGTDTWLMLSGASRSAFTAESRVLSCELLATNGELASEVRPGELSSSTPSSPTFGRFNNISAVAPSVPAPTDQDLTWRCLSHCAMSLRTLTQPEVLKAVLALNNLQAASNHQAARANDIRINAVRNVAVVPVERVYRGSLIRGISVDVGLQESGFASAGDLYLFGRVLNRLFSSYVSINSFTRTSVHAVDTRTRYTFADQSGALIL